MPDQTKKVPIKWTGDQLLAKAIISGSTDRSVAQMEQEGQLSFVDSDTLPSDIRNIGDCNGRETLEAAGIIFDGPVDDDDLFQYVTLPKGWYRAKTDHVYTSKLIDPKGRCRATILYVATPHDRKAHLSLNTRFRIWLDRRPTEGDACIVHALDGNGIIHTVTSPAPTDWKERSALEDKLWKTVIAWLEERYPDWKNPSAYWD